MAQAQLNSTVSAPPMGNVRILAMPNSGLEASPLWSVHFLLVLSCPICESVKDRDPQLETALLVHIVTVKDDRGTFPVWL